MAYDHSVKIGNEGDTLKHATLSASLDELLSRLTEASFTYVESHAGRAVYKLVEGGEWERGIGRLSRYGASSTLQKDNRLLPYLRTCFSGHLVAGEDYLGSSAIVYRMLTGREMAFTFHLWDSDQGVRRDLKRFYGDVPNVFIHQGDGYAGLMGIDQAHLALVDPVSPTTRLRSGSSRS